MGIGILILSALLSLFFIPIPIIYRVFDKNGPKNFWKFTAFIAFLYVLAVCLLLYAASMSDY